MLKTLTKLKHLSNVILILKLTLIIRNLLRTNYYDSFASWYEIWQYFKPQTHFLTHLSHSKELHVYLVDIKGNVSIVYYVYGFEFRQWYIKSTIRINLNYNFIGIAISSQPQCSCFYVNLLLVRWVV